MCGIRLQDNVGRERFRFRKSIFVTSIINGKKDLKGNKYENLLREHLQEII